MTIFARHVIQTTLASDLRSDFFQRKIKLELLSYFNVQLTNFTVLLTTLGLNGTLKVVAQNNSVHF